MKGDRYEVLYQAVRTLNSALPFPRSCKDLLGLLRQALTLRSLSFHLTDNRRNLLVGRIDASGPLLLQSCRQQLLADAPEAVALQTRQPVRSGDLWCFPVSAGRTTGLLRVRTFPDQPLPEEWAAMFRFVTEELARSLGNEHLRHRERKRIAQLTLLAELNGELHRAGSVEKLVQAGFAVLRKHTSTAGIILSLRPEKTLLEAQYHCFSPEFDLRKQHFTRLEEALAVAVATSQRPRSRRLTKCPGQNPEATMTGICIPLSAQGRFLGTLTIFYGDEKGASADAGRTEQNFFATVAIPFADAIDSLRAKEALAALSRENDRKLRETALLYRISRAIHSTLNLNELMHLILSVAVSPGGGGFERAMLFTVNERTETLQGILCVTRETAALVIPREKVEWEWPVVSAEAQEAQRNAPDCKVVMKQRLPLASDDNPLALCVRLGQAIFEPHPESEVHGARKLAAALDLGPFACAPLAGREKALGVLLVDNPLSRVPLSSDRRRFFEMFASQAGAAMENSMLLHRLETAHQDLRETQARLIQGEKMATLGEMAASIAHELRNPLVPIGGFAERLGRLAVSGSREQEYAEIILREVRRMEEMLANILLFSKKQMLCFRECRIEAVIDEALKLEAESLAAAGVEVVRDIAPALPVLQCDDQKLRQVLINLITNARQAMPGGGILTLRAGPGKLRGEEALEIEVEDRGSGIPMEVLPNLFNPFFTTKEKGTGLGLSISQRIIEHHGGEIEIRNLPQGVVFILRLPILPVSLSQH